MTTRWLVALVVGCAATQVSLSGQQRLPLGADLQGRAAAAEQWLEHQVTPNGVIPDPDATRRGLLISYDFTPAQFPNGYHRSATYDDAVAALAFFVTGHRERAALTLAALARLVRPDGSLWFTYNTANNWPTEKDHESALVRTGAVAWAGYALTFYLTHTAARRNDAGDARERALFLATARRLGVYLMSLQEIVASDPREGLLRLGYGSISLAYDRAARKVIERYGDAPALGVSTENNIIAWFFLVHLGALTSDTAFRHAASRIEHALQTRLWNDRMGQFNEGFSATGALDSNKALDCASLGALFLAAQRERAKAARALAAVERYYRSHSDAVTGYRPYADRPVYEDSAVAGFFFPGHPERQWRDLPLVWSEGSLQAALAYLRLGHPRRARRIAEDLRTLQKETGGVRYATMEVPFEMASVPSAAGSAWLIFLAAALGGNTSAVDILR